MGIDNVSNNTPNYALATASPELNSTNALAYAQSLPPAALQSPQVQALLASISPSLNYAFTDRPVAFSQVAQFDPSQFTANLQSASDSVQGVLDDLGSQADASLADANKIMADAKASGQPLSPEQYQKMMQDYQNYQLLMQLQSTILNIIAGIKKQIIENMKVQG